MALGVAIGLIVGIAVGSIPYLVRRRSDAADAEQADGEHDHVE